MGPIAKWVDDHLFFRVPQTHLSSYNATHANWHRKIQENGGCRQEGGRIWFGGKGSHHGRAEEFNEDCSVPLHDLSHISPCLPTDRKFTYTDTDINHLSIQLGIKWQDTKSIPFGEEVPTWVSTGTCAHRKYTFLTRRRRSTWRPSRSGLKNEHPTLSKRRSSTESYSMLHWLSQQDTLTSQTWRLCSPPSITVLSTRIPPHKALLTTWCGGNTNSGTQASSSAYPGPNPLLSSEPSQT